MTRSPSKVLLVNMPFAAPAIPSLALTQLHAVAAARFAGQLQIETLYLNHDFARYLGDLGAYKHVLSNQGFMTGIGDWFFRTAAFPATPDNSGEYFARYYAGADAPAQRAWNVLLSRRADVGALLDSWIAQYRLAEAGVVGFTALFAQTVAAFAMARRIKALNPNTIILMGGAACSDEMGLEFSRRVEAIDYFFSGPGLVSFPAFLRGWLDGDLPAAARLPGVFPGISRAPSPAAPPAAASGQLLGDDLDLDTPVPLAYDGFLDSLERAFPGGEFKPILPFETSRGCWWGERQRCAFCGLNGPALRFRAMRAERAIAQIRALFAYAPRCVFLESVDTILPKNYLADVLPALHPPPGLKVQYEVRPLLGEAELQTLCAAGVTVLQPGIESLATATLKLMRKGTTAFQNLRFLKACSKFPLEVGWNLLIYSPGESEATYARYLRDLPLLMHLHPPQAASLVGFVRYSEYYERARAYGLDLQPEDYYRLTFPFDEAGLARVAVKFYDARADADRMADWLRRLNAAIDRWRTRWLNQDGQAEARLCLVCDGDAAVVYDSRPGAPRQHALTTTQRAVLELLETPRTPADLAKGLPQTPATDLDGALAFFSEHGLVFEEDGRYLSLVIS
ncbi:MAG: RiPP maturation radical SAM C-methyltransferase [Kiritimatiellaeota bacterium]|nr:RiPP maturation radical SAM C-methyltransferase [Kiritimatiellota bacterium]